MRYCGQVLFLHARHISCGGRQSSQQSRNITRYLRQQPSDCNIWGGLLGLVTIDWRFWLGQNWTWARLGAAWRSPSLLSRKAQVSSKFGDLKINSVTMVTLVKTQWSRRVKRPITCPASWKLHWRHTQLQGICALYTCVFRKCHTLFPWCSLFFFQTSLKQRSKPPYYFSEFFSQFA